MIDDRKIGYISTFVGEIQRNHGDASEQLFARERARVSALIDAVENAVKLIRKTSSRCETIALQNMLDSHEDAISRKMRELLEADRALSDFQFGKGK